MHAVLIQVPDANLPSLDAFKGEVYEHSFPHVLAWLGALITIGAAISLLRALASR